MLKNLIRGAFDCQYRSFVRQAARTGNAPAFYFNEGVQKAKTPKPAASFGLSRTMTTTPNRDILLPSQ